MDIISTKRASLKEVFKLLDTRNISNIINELFFLIFGRPNHCFYEIARIDSCELFSVMLFIAKGDYETILTSNSYYFIY